MNQLKTLFGYRELIWNLVLRDLKGRYKGSLLGFLWTVLTPLFMALIYIVFLRLIGGRGIDIRNEDIIIGVFAWQFTVQAITSGTSCVSGSANLVKKVFFPRFMLPLSITISALINFLLMLAVQLLVVGILLLQKDLMLSGACWLLPAVVTYHFFFNLSLVFLLSAANVYYRDTQHVVGLFLSAWFFMSPVMYSVDLILRMTADTPHLLQIYMLNPLAQIITAYRAVQLPGAEIITSPAALIGWIWPIPLLVASYIIFQKAQRNFADQL
jgi:ABC-type polysaccharide/polyol phosphate export permease